MKRTSCFALAAALAAAAALGAAGPPLAGVWNIATAGKATSSGDLSFRITANDGSDPVDITVPVISGASEDSMARTIQRALSSQLPRDRYKVQLGEGTNVLVSDPRGRPNFSLELVDSDIENVRVAVQSVTPSAPPTVPPQTLPAEAPPPAPGANVPVPSPATPLPNPTPVPNPSVPVPNPSPPPNATPGSPPGTTAPPPASGAPAPDTAAPSPGAAAPAGGASAPPPG